MPNGPSKKKSFGMTIENQKNCSTEACAFKSADPFGVDFKN
jgi:hypothetical protein